MGKKFSRWLGDLTPSKPSKPSKPLRPSKPSILSRQRKKKVFSKSRRRSRGNFWSDLSEKRIRIK